MKKQFISPLLGILAMLLLVVPKIIMGKPLDWLSYVAIGLIIAGVVAIVLELRKLK